MAIDFPNSPVTNQLYAIGDKAWKFDGEKWISIENSANASNQLYDVTVLLRMETN